MQVNPAANFLYAGDEGGTAQIYSFSIAADGSLTQLGPQGSAKGHDDSKVNWN